MRTFLSFVAGTAFLPRTSPTRPQSSWCSWPSRSPHTRKVSSSNLDEDIFGFWARGSVLWQSPNYVLKANHWDIFAGTLISPFYHVQQSKHRKQVESPAGWAAALDAPRGPSRNLESPAGWDAAWVLPAAPAAITSRESFWAALRCLWPTSGAFFANFQCPFSLWTVKNKSFVSWGASPVLRSPDGVKGQAWQLDNLEKKGMLVTPKGGKRGGKRARFGGA
jgi:hypothetical protein